jgi:hypothetical protein
MSMPERKRGAIYNEELARQINDFTELLYGRRGMERKITPMDIDGFIDFGKQLFVYLEGKLTTKVLDGGQRVAFERMVDQVKSPTRSIGIVYVHLNREGDVDVANSVVREYRWNGAWHQPQDAITVRQAIDATIAHLGLDYW